MQLVNIAVMRYTTETNPTIFGKILRKEIPARVVYEDDHVLAFHDIQPQAPVHVVIIPKQHLTSLASAQPTDIELLGRLMTAIPNVAKAAGVLESGFRITSNSGEHAGQTVPHLHIHLFGGMKMSESLVR